MSALRNVVAVLALLLTCALGVAHFLAPRLDATLDRSQFAADTGFSFIGPVPLEAPPGYVMAGDGVGSNASTLRLLENGRELGPPHATHSEIREKGGGRYSHWGTSLYFSASDSSDPRSNGRTYSISAIPALNPVVVTAVVLVDALALVLGWRWLLLIGRYRRLAANVVVAAMAVLAALAAAGVFGRIGTNAGEPKDAALVVATLLHAVLGCAIVLAQWMAGAGLARLALGAARATTANVLLLGFALSLPAVAILSVVALAIPYGIGLAALGWALCCVPLRAWRPAPGELAGIARASIAILPLAVGFGCWIGLHWHGPTATLPGSPSGDLVYYSTSIVSLGKQLYPYLNLGYEREPLNLYFNMLFPLAGAALSGVVAIDPFLFIAASGSAFCVLSLGIALHVYARGAGILTSGTLALVFLALAIIVANRYPYWVVESVPMIYLVPLVLSVVHFARKSDTRAQVLAFAIAVVGSALGKVVGAAVLAPFAAAAATARFFHMSRRLRTAAIAVGIAGAIFAAVLLYQFWTINFSIASLGPFSLDMIRRYQPSLWTALPFVLRDISAVALTIVAFLLVDWLIACAIALGFLLFLFYPYLLQADFVCSVLLLGVLACDRPERLWKHRFVAFAALLLALPAAVLTDPAGVWSGVAWIVCVGGTVGIALTPERELSWPGWSRTMAAASLVLCLGLFAAARGNLVLDSGWRPGGPELTPKVREVWLAVKDRTPPDALIFTDQVSLVPTLLGSWNLYAFIGERQIFASNFYMNAATRTNLALAADVLKENDAVLAGRLAPTQLSLRGRYSGYYAVVSRTRTVPSGWAKMFENEQWALYRIISDS